jgi:hypothetical protein
MVDIQIMKIALIRATQHRDINRMGRKASKTGTRPSIMRCAKRVIAMPLNHLQAARKNDEGIVIIIVDCICFLRFAPALRCTNRHHIGGKQRT